MPSKIFLRHDQSIGQRATSKSDSVFVYGPTWVREGLQILCPRLKNKEFVLMSKPSLKRGRNSSAPDKGTQEAIEKFTISEDFNNWDLVQLQKIARNEPKNTNGRIVTSYYQPDIPDLKLIYSIKDLARQTVIVGKDMTTFCGGYKCPREKQEGPVYVCDLAALQFQHPYNSGRLVLIQEKEDGAYKGPLDDFIFENVVGEKKKLYKDVLELISKRDKDASSRYLKQAEFGKGGSCFMDIVAYKRFVKLDVILSGLALAEVASNACDKLNFKFLKYGTGYFAGKFANALNSQILGGVIDGLEELFGEKYEDKNVKEVIKCVSFPFYECDPESKRRLEGIKLRYKVDYSFSRLDALKQVAAAANEGLITATTNCADGNVACGNAMGFKSTDGAIAENLASKGNIFCPNLNTSIKFKYVDIV